MALQQTAASHIAQIELVHQPSLPTDMADNGVVDVVSVPEASPGGAPEALTGTPAQDLSMPPPSVKQPSAAKAGQAGDA